MLPGKWEGPSQEDKDVYIAKQRSTKQDGETGEAMETEWKFATCHEEKFSFASSLPSAPGTAGMLHFCHTV